MKATYNKTKIMRNAWYLKKVQPSQAFSACLKKAWRNEKLASISARVEGREVKESNAGTYHPEALQVPTNYYGVRGMYYGD